MAWLDSAIAACEIVESELKSEQNLYGVGWGEHSGQFMLSKIVTTERVSVWRALSKTGADAKASSLASDDSVKAGSLKVVRADDSGQYHVHVTTVTRTKTVTYVDQLEPWDVPHLAR